MLTSDDKIASSCHASVSIHFVHFSHLNDSQTHQEKRKTTTTRHICTCDLIECATKTNSYRALSPLYSTYTIRPRLYNVAHVIARLARSATLNQTDRDRQPRLVAVFVPAIHQPGPRFGALFHVLCGVSGRAR